MITFSCSICNAQYNVDDSKEGQMGRCTNCNSVMRVPAKSTNMFQIFKGNDYFSDKKMNKLYTELLRTYESNIISQQINRGKDVEIAVLEIRTERLRTQLIDIFRVDLGEVMFVGIASKVGDITTTDDAVHALRSVSKFSIFTVSLNEENELWVSNMRLMEGFTAREFAAAIEAVALHADELEKEIFGTDQH